MSVWAEHLLEYVHGEQGPHSRGLGLPRPCACTSSSGWLGARLIEMARDVGPAGCTCAQLSSAAA